jgi:signal transduction histidine kinase
MSQFRTVRHRLWFRLTTAFLLVALVGVAVVALLANRATTTGFNRFLMAEEDSTWSNLATRLGESYARTEGWSEAEAILASAVGPGRGGGGVQLTVLDLTGATVATAGMRRGQMGQGQGGEPQPLTVNAGGQTVGTLLIAAPGMGNSRAGQQFLAEVNRAIWLGGLAAVLLAIALGGWLAYRLTRPLRELTTATQELAAGRLQQAVTVHDEGELGQLAAEFNRMAENLAEAEGLRRQLLADVAHELRTPLSVLRGQLEAMLDGVFPLTADNVAVAHEETVLLGRLVDDLRTLSLAEAGQLPLTRRAIDPAEAIARAAAAFASLYESENVILRADTPASLPPVWADGERLEQVFGNLLANALRYAPHGGAEQPEVRLSAASDSDEVRFTIADNGPGLSEDAQAHMFDRFWRGDRSRNRAQGGSGLGLAISRAIVESHGGRIWVESRTGKGTAFHVALPVQGAR